MIDERRLEVLLKLARHIQVATEASEEALNAPEMLLTSADLARLLKLDRDYIKKNLKFLKDLGLIRSMGLNPKYYRFDQFQYKQLLLETHEDEDAQAFLSRFQSNLYQNAFSPPSF